MSVASDELRARLQRLLDGDFVERKIVGGIGFMLGGNLTIGITGKSALLVRVDPDHAQAAIVKGAAPMKMGTRPMKGYVRVEAAGLDDAALKDWIAYATKYVKTLPPK